MNNYAVLVIILIILILFLDYKRVLFVTPAAFVSAFLIANLSGTMNFKDALSMMPITTMYDIFIITFFFGFAIDNGTLELLVDKALYHMRKFPALIQPGIYLLSMFIAFLGPGVMAVAFMAPLAFSVARKSNTSEILPYAATTLGCIWGSNFVGSAGGSAVASLVRETGLTSVAIDVALEGYVWTGLITTIVFIAIYILTQGWYAKKAEVTKPAKMNIIQRKNAILIIIMLILFILPFTLNQIFVESKIGKIATFFDIKLLMAVGCCAASTLKLGDSKKIIKLHIPWSLITMIGAMGMLMGVGKQVGLVELILSWLDSFVGTSMIVPVLALIAGILSMFASAIGVVIPMLYAIVPELAVAYGLNPVPLLVAPFVAATLTGSSPLSSTGGMAIGSNQSNNTEKLFYLALTIPIVLLVITICVSCLF
jgi:di/tricarboxylate transporter